MTRDWIVEFKDADGKFDELRMKDYSEEEVEVWLNGYSLATNAMCKYFKRFTRIEVSIYYYDSDLEPRLYGVFVVGG